MNHLRFFICLLVITISPSIFAQTNYYVDTTSDRSDANLSDGVCADVFGFCSLRAAMEQANANDGNTTIRFVINTPATISPTNELPILKYPSIIIDASAHALGSITIDGNNDVSNGFIIDADNCGVGGLYIKNFVETGILVTKMGTNAFIQYNAINYNGQGIYAQGSFLYLDSNYIGMHPTTGDAEGNESYGIEIFGSDINVAVGGEGGNIIGSNGGSGLYIHGNVNADIYYNHFGTRENRDLYRPNGTSSGIGCGAWLDVHQNNELVVEGNVFYYNEPHGLRTGSTTNNTSIRFNEFHSQEAYGIWMEGAPLGSVNHTKHITQNSFYCNSEGGIHQSLNANENVAAPKIIYVSETEVVGIAPPNAKIEVYVDKFNCTNCQGERYVGIEGADAQGNWSLNITANLNDIVSATATVNSSTSEFSNCKRIQVNNDEPCINGVTALELPHGFECEAQVICASTYNATDSSPLFGDPLEECKGDETLFTEADIWFTSTVPNTGNLMIRQNIGTDIDIMMEVYIGDCFSSMKRIDCANFYYGGKYYVYEEAVHGYPEGNRLFFRVYDTKADGNFDIGNVALSAHVLDGDREKWTFCDEGGGTYPPKEFIVTFKTGIHPDTIGDYIKWMEAQGAELSKQCSCAPNEILLWSSNSYLEMETSIRRTRTRTKADTTNYQALYNYFAGDFYPLNTQGTNPDATEEKFNPEYTPNQEVKSKIGVVDTGIDPGHPDLNDAVWQNPEANNTCVQAADHYGYDFSGSTTAPEPYDLDGHGTAVNGVFVQQNLAVEMLPIGVELMNSKFYAANEGKLFDAVCGMYYNLEQDADVLNLSFGLKTQRIPKILKDVLDITQQQDVVVITSAGNFGDDNDDKNNGKWPANYSLDNMITVAALEVIGSDTLLPSYSNYGDTTVHLAAQGMAQLPVAGSDALDIFTGTSIAAPFVSRTAAVIRALYPDLSAAQVVDCIINTTSFQNSMVDKVQTNGVLNHAAALHCASLQTPALATVMLELAGKRTPQQQVALKWQIQGLTNLWYYELERSIDGQQWTVIHTTEQRTFLDTAAPATAVWYRLKSISQNGTTFVSKPQNIGAVHGNTLQVFPNPLQNNKLRLQVPPNWLNQPLNCTLHDVQGRILWQNHGLIQHHEPSWTLPSLVAGVYWLVAESGGKVEQHKIIITH